MQSTLSRVFILIGAIIMFLSILKFQHTFLKIKEIPKENRKNISLLLRIHILLMIFFLAGYIIVGAAFYLKLHIVSELFVGLIFMLGASFVFLGIKIQDILDGEQKKANNEKEQLWLQLIQSGKMVAVGQLAGGVAHEINNPLTVILGYAQYIIKRTKENGPLREPAKSIEYEAVKCKELVRSLLAFSRTDKTHYVMTDINGAIDEALLLMGVATTGLDVDIVKEYGRDLPQIPVHKNQIQQVIINICNNAIDAMPEGGKITIGTRTYENKLEIIVSDTGRGMTQEIRQRIFEPFFTTKEVGKGTGLGLSLCYEIIQKHGGSIEVESELNKGTAFRIILNCSEKDN